MGPPDRPKPACIPGLMKMQWPQDWTAAGPRWQDARPLPSGPGCPHGPLLAQAKTQHLLSHAGLPGLALLPADVAGPGETQAPDHPLPGAQAQHTPLVHHSCTGSRFPHACRETRTRPWPTTSRLCFQHSLLHFLFLFLHCQQFFCQSCFATLLIQIHPVVTSFY